MMAACALRRPFATVLLWVDPLYEIVATYFSVVLELTPWEEHKWPVDLFMNAVTAAVEPAAAP